MRFFSDDGKPTSLVSDGGRKTHDRPPSSLPVQAVRLTAESVSTQSNSDATGGQPAQFGASGSPNDLPSHGDEYVGGDRHPAMKNDDHSLVLTSVPMKISYGVVLTIIVVSALALAVVHFDAKNRKP